MPVKITAFCYSYVRDGVPGLSLDQQEEILIATGFVHHQHYRDFLVNSQIKRRDPLHLQDRARMFERLHHKHGVTLHVATLSVLGWSMADITSTLAAAAKRGFSVHCADTNETYTPANINSSLMLALAETEGARRRGQTASARSIGKPMLATNKATRRAAAMTIARPLWLLPSKFISITEIAALTKVSGRSLQKWFGPRCENGKPLDCGATVVPEACDIPLRPCHNCKGLPQWGVSKEKDWPALLSHQAHHCGASFGRIIYHNTRLEAAETWNSSMVELKKRATR